jgi:hydroxymethylpyrimidine/phosphomethylpyrimidine kinase
MTIATSDSGGGAGIQADLKAFARCGVHGTSAIVALTAQNTKEVVSVETLPRQFILDQVRAVAGDIGVDAVKIGMLFDEPTIDAVADALDLVGDAPIVVDPVMVAESGAVLLEPDAVESYKNELFPLATAITPNINEAFALLGEEVDEDRVEDCAVTLHALGPKAVIITGGHTASGADLLYDREGFEKIEGPVYPSENTHGAGCTHSSSLASFLAMGYPLVEAAHRAHAVASEAVEYGLGEIGKGVGPVHALGRVLEGVER